MPTLIDIYWHLVKYLAFQAKITEEGPRNPAAIEGPATTDLVAPTRDPRSKSFRILPSPSHVELRVASMLPQKLNSL